MPKAHCSFVHAVGNPGVGVGGVGVGVGVSVGVDVGGRQALPLSLTPYTRSQTLLSSLNVIFAVDNFEPKRRAEHKTTALNGKVLFREAQQPSNISVLSTLRTHALVMLMLMSRVAACAAGESSAACLCRPYPLSVN